MKVEQVKECIRVLQSDIRKRANIIAKYERMVSHSKGYIKECKSDTNMFEDEVNYHIRCHNYSIKSARQKLIPLRKNQAAMKRTLGVLVNQQRMSIILSSID